MKEIINKITTWGCEKGIITLGQRYRFEGNVIAQLKKSAEEIIEATEAWCEFSALDHSVDKDEAFEEVVKELGDVGVTWIMSCRAANVKPETALEAAYEKIRSRKGVLKNGQFIKTPE